MIKIITYPKILFKWWILFKLWQLEKIENKQNQCYELKFHGKKLMLENVSIDEMKLLIPLLSRWLRSIGNDYFNDCQWKRRNHLIVVVSVVSDGTYISTNCICTSEIDLLGSDISFRRTVEEMKQHRNNKYQLKWL